MMKFNSHQTKIIRALVKKYQDDEKYRNDIKNKYSKNPHELSIYEIYILERIFWYGSKGIFDTLFPNENASSNKETLNTIDLFQKMIKNDTDFRNYKLRQFEESPENLSDMEKYLLSLMKEASLPSPNTKEKLLYDDFIPIRYDTEPHLRETISNLVIGQVIFEMLKLSELKEIRERQQKPGQIAAIDKETVISLIREMMPEMIFDLAETTDFLAKPIILGLVATKNSNILTDLSKFCTNVSIREIFQLPDEIAPGSSYTMK